MSPSFGTHPRSKKGQRERLSASVDEHSSLPSLMMSKLEREKSRKGEGERGGGRKGEREREEIL